MHVFVDTVGVIEDVEDVLPVVVMDDVDDGGGVERSNVERERRLIVHDLGVVTLTESQAAAQGLVDGGRGADDRKLKVGGEVEDDVGCRTGCETEERQQAFTPTGQSAHYTITTPH